MRTGKLNHVFMIAMMMLLIGAAAGAVDESDLRMMPGYVDFDDIVIPDDAGEVTIVNLDPALLKMAAGSQENGDSALTDALSGLFSIRVKAFDVNPEYAAELRPIVDRIDQQLKNDDWHEMVRVKDGEELTVVSMKYNNDRVAGLFVMAFEPGSEVAFVNIVGDLDLSKIGEMIGSLDGADFEGLEDLINHQNTSDTGKE